MADLPGLNPACASPNIACVAFSMPDKPASDKKHFYQAVEVDLDEMDHAKAMEFGPSCFLFQDCGDNFLLANEGNTELGA